VFSSSVISVDDYDSFFKSFFGEFLDPIAHTHFSVGSAVNVKGILFVPSSVSSANSRGLVFM
jgi:heat shock protein beta